MTLIFSLLWLNFFSCRQKDETIHAYTVMWNGQDLQSALDDLERKCSTQPTTSSGYDEDIKKLNEKVRQLRNDVDRLDATMEVIRETLDTVQEGGISHARLIPFDPRETNLDAKDLQSALTEMMSRLASLEHKIYDDLGDPGPGLFAIPKEKKGNGPAGPPPNGGPGGPPPNGGPGNGPSGPPPQ